MEQDVQGFTLASPTDVDRDYIVSVADLRDVGLWPPENGDTVDDENDIDGVTNRYRVMSIPGQAHWRYLRGSYTDQARVHTKFFQPFDQAWADAFTDTNGTALTAHTPDTPAAGTYSGGTGTVTITSNRIRAGVETAYTYFNHGVDDGADSQAEISLGGIEAADLEGESVELGLVVRAATSGGGLRNGYYCTLRVEYTDGEQTVTRLRILEGATQKAYVDISDVSLDAVYQLVVRDDLESVTVSLLDDAGEVTIASVRYATTTYVANTGGGVYFAHAEGMDNFDLPYLDDLTVTQ